MPSPKPIPPEIDRWNWGAFLLNWIWGVGNNTFIALLTLVPIVGFVMIFVLGAKGSRWAWRNGRWDSVEHFKRVQRLWAIWGVIIWVGGIALFGGIIGGVPFSPPQTFRSLPTRRVQTSGQPRSDRCSRYADLGRLSDRLDLFQWRIRDGNLELFGERPESGGRGFSGGGKKRRSLGVSRGLRSNSTAATARSTRQWGEENST